MALLAMLWARFRWALAIAGALAAAFAWGLLQGRLSARARFERKRAEARARWEHAARKRQQDYATTPEPDDETLEDKLRRGGFVIALALLPFLGGCASAALPPIEPGAFCPTPTPVAAPVQKKAAQELRLCGNQCKNVRKLLRVAARDRENMRKCIRGQMK